MSRIEFDQPLGIYLASAADQKPVLADLTADLKLVSITCQDGSKLQQAEFRDDLGSSRNVENFAVSAAMNRQVEVWILDENGDRTTPLFWGEIHRQRIKFTETGEESRYYFARIHWAHCGGLILGQQAATGSVTPYELVDYDIEFNPEVDGIVIPNGAIPSDTNLEPFYWIDPEAQRTTGAKLLHDVASPVRWFLEDVVHAIIKYGNSNETHVTNLDRPDITTQLNSLQQINNLVLKRGQPVARMLDDALRKYGRSWSIELELDEISEPYPILIPKFRFYVQGKGAEREVKWQAVGSALDHTQHDINEMDISFDYGELSNKVILQGALRERQITIELYRSWPVADDVNYDDEDPGEPIGRKWVAGEAGDLLDGPDHDNLSGIRPEIPDTPPTLTDEVDAYWDTRRRVAEDMLTLRGDERHPAELEYSLDDGATWNPVDQDWGWRLLSNELGVYFTGRPIPFEALDADCRLRLTCTVRGDRRIESIETDATSPNSLELPLYIDVSDRFFDQARVTTGSTATTFGTPAQTQDDQSDIDALATESLERDKGVDISGTIALRGLRPEFQVGDVITKIAGREISLNRLPGTPGRYPQIMQVTFKNEPHQETILQLG